jgi:hypothetical protein
MRADDVKPKVVELLCLQRFYCRSEDGYPRGLRDKFGSCNR